MYTPLATVAEAGEPTPASTLPALPGIDLSPVECMILCKLFEGKKLKQIAREVGRTSQTVDSYMKKPALRQAIQHMREGLLSQVARGEFGVMAAFKQAAVGAATRIIGLSKDMQVDARVRLQANTAILDRAGILPPKPQVIESPERLIDAMTGEEAELFARDGVFPERFKDQLARLATSVLEKNEQKRWAPRIEVGEEG